MSKVPIHELPLPATTVQGTLSRLALAPEPTAQRRSTTFSSNTPGVWARTYPLWAAWPLRITKEEVEVMGVDLDKGEKVDVEDVLRRWDAVDPVEGSSGESSNGLRLMTSKHRSTLDSQILGISPAALRDSLPHLDVGDAVEVCNGGAEEAAEEAGKARLALSNFLSGKHVLVSEKTKPREVPVKKDTDSDSDDAADPRDLGEEPEYGPWSTRYCGHQFGSWAGQLGDGRAISLLETQSPEGGRQEIQLKGGGRTPFSRTADGLAVLRSGVREFLACEAVHALDIPATRSLALLTTPGLPVIRENGAEPPSLLARLAPSFIRIGHFQALNPGKAGQDFRQFYLGGSWAKGDDQEETSAGPLGGQGNLEGLRELTVWCKSLLGLSADSSTEEFVKEVARRNAEMVGKWQVYGWMHGVLNTDNISILGLTIDFGPYAFMDIWDEGHICNHSDPSGLYSYRRQPERVLFALDKLATTLYPLIGYEKLHGTAQAGFSEGKTPSDVKEWNAAAEESMKGWEEVFWDVEKLTERQGWQKRFGLQTYRDSDDRDIFFDYLTILRTYSVDFNASFRRLSTFQPSRVDEERYLRLFSVDFIADCTTTLRSDSVDDAIAAIKGWLEVYAKRATVEEEVQAWQKVDAGSAALDLRKALETGLKGEGWERNRELGMKSVNPRFVLRQWVLEEVIDQLHKNLDDIKESRKVLARVLDMSLNPFHPYGEDGQSTGEGAVRERLCGLGKREMLGFQCSCSS